MATPTASSRARLRHLIAAAIVLASSGRGGGAALASASDHPVDLHRVAVPFVANDGALDSRVAFSAATLAGAAFVTREGSIVLSLAPRGEASPGWTLVETPATAAPLRPVGVERSAARVGYFLGDDRARWRTAAPTYRTVALGAPWPGITVDLRAYGGEIERLFTVAPGADAARIRMELAGADALVGAGDGSLRVVTGAGEMRLTAPIAWQESGGERRPVAVRYRVEGSGYGFELGEHDPRLAVVIDPLLQSTFLGGSGGDQADAIAVHPISGEIYVAGQTSSTNFPGTAGGAVATNAGANDAFVARLNAGLTAILQATYLGGGDAAANDGARALAIDPTSGDVFVAGFTQLDGFPGTDGGAQADFGGGVQDGFVARLDATLTALEQSTYLGGGDSDAAFALALTSGALFVAGPSGVSGQFDVCACDFPGVAGGAQASHGGRFDAFVARLDPALTTIAQSTYLGGSDLEVAFGLSSGLGLEVHPGSGDVYAAFTTASDNVPGTTNGAQATTGGQRDVMVARLAADLETLLQATYLGGTLRDEAHALAIHPTSGDLYVGGTTQSANLPSLAGGAQTMLGSTLDAFVARLASTLEAIGQSTYLGGGGDEDVRVIEILASGDVLAMGETFSTNFPATAGGAQAVKGAGLDAFAARLGPALTAFGQATYLGGSGGDAGEALAIHPATGDVYVAGLTTGATFPGTAGGAQTGPSGVSSGFVARLTSDLAAGVAPPTPTATATTIASSTATPTPTPTRTPTAVPPTATVTSTSPATIEAVDIPALSPTMLALLGVGLAAGALLVLRRRP
jgi:hypothetical protein